MIGIVNFLYVQGNSVSGPQSIVLEGLFGTEIFFPPTKEFCYVTEGEGAGN